MAIVLILIAFILLVSAFMLHRAADDKNTKQSQESEQNSRISFREESKSDSSLECLPLYQSLSQKEKLNCMCLMFLCSGLAQKPHAKQESQNLISFISKCVGINLDEVKRYLQNVINTSEDDSFVDNIIQIVSSIRDKNVIDMIAFNCYALWSFEPLADTQERVMEIIHKLGYSNYEFEELLKKQKAISDSIF